MKKGKWFYELQIFCVLFMWRHDLTVEIQPKYWGGLHLGRLWIKYDAAWIRSKSIYNVYLRILNSEPIKFLKALYVFIELYYYGFKITKYRFFHDSPFTMYRFFWNDKILKDFPDIDRAEHDHWVSVRNGKVIKL